MSIVYRLLASAICDAFTDEEGVCAGPPWVAPLYHALCDAADELDARGAASPAALP